MATDDLASDLGNRLDEARLLAHELANALLIAADELGALCEHGANAQHPAFRAWVAIQPAVNRARDRRDWPR